MQQSSKKRNYHFSDLANPTRYNLAQVLDNMGYKSATMSNTDASSANFSDNNLLLPPEATCWLEEKHRMAALLNDYQNTIIPETYIIDDYNFTQVLNHLTETYYLQEQGLQESIPSLAWILKPSLQNNGENIHIFTNISKLWDHYSMGHKRLGGPHVLQRYINSPLLYEGKKHTLRLYLIITNYCGAYVYHHGYINQSLQPFVSDNFDDLAVHLTNEHLGGTLCNLKQTPTFDYPFYDQIKLPAWEITRKLLHLLDMKFNSWRHPKRPFCPAFDIFGIDFLVDQEMQPWIIEVNHGPHFPTTKPHALTAPLLAPFWQDVVDTFVLPIATNKAKAKPIAAKTRNWFNGLLKTPISKTHLQCERFIQLLA